MCVPAPSQQTPTRNSRNPGESLSDETDLYSPETPATSTQADINPADTPTSPSGDLQEPDGSSGSQQEILVDDYSGCPELAQTSRLHKVAIEIHSHSIDPKTITPSPGPYTGSSEVVVNSRDQSHPIGITYSSRLGVDCAR